MADPKSAEGAGVNWPIIAFGVMALMIVVVIVPDAALRMILAAMIMILIVYVAQSRPEPEIESPVFEQLHSRHGEGLDRRKYGRLRSHTDRLLDHIRQMNRIAVEGREGKIASRHAQAEMDRLTEMLKELIDDIRKNAGVPTPQGEPGGKKPSQPQIVMPKPVDESEEAPPSSPQETAGSGPPSSEERPRAEP